MKYDDIAFPDIDSASLVVLSVVLQIQIHTCVDHMTHGLILSVG